MLPVLTGGAGVPPRDAIVHHDTRGGFAIRQGPWKLVILVDYDTPPVFELYNLEDDIGETRNVRDAHPDTADRLLALLERYVREGRSTPGPAQPNDTDAIDIRARARERWAPPRYGRGGDGSIPFCDKLPISRREIQKNRLGIARKTLVGPPEFLS